MKIDDPITDGPGVGVTTRVACLGDSITRGSGQRRLPGAARPAARNRRAVLSRFGVNGDFAYNLLQRLDPAIGSPPT